MGGRGTEEGEAQSSMRRLLCAGIAVPAVLGAAPLHLCAITLPSPTLSVPPGLSPWLLTGNAVQYGATHRSVRMQLLQHNSPALTGPRCARQCEELSTTAGSQLPL